MSVTDKKHQLREHLALISTEVYLLLRAEDEEDRIERYNIVQQEIDAIIEVIDNSQLPQPSRPDKLFQ